jgi:hypothetical protein
MNEFEVKFDMSKTFWDLNQNNVTFRLISNE